MKKLATILLLFVFILNLYACGIFGNDGIESIEVDLHQNSAFFMDTFEISEIELILIKENGTRERIQLEESMILNEDRMKLNEVGEHLLHVEYQGFSTSFTIRMLDRLFVEQMRMLHRIEGRTSDFDIWYAQLDDTFNEVDFDEASIKIDIYGTVFVVENETSVSLGSYFADHKSGFLAYVEDYFFNSNDEVIIEIPGNISLNFGELEVYWETLEPSPYIEYQTRYLNYERSETEFLFDVLMNHLTHDDRFSLHFSEATIIDYETLFAFSSGENVKVAGIVTEVLSNGFIISDYEHAIMVYTFGQTQFRSIEEGSVITVSGNYLIRNQSYYLRATDYTLYQEDVEYNVSVNDITIKELYEDQLYDVSDFGKTYRIIGGLFTEDGSYYIEQETRRVELTWLTSETRNQLNAYVGKKIEIEVILFDFHNTVFSAIFSGAENTLFDTESVEYELDYDIREILNKEILTYGYYDNPLELIYEGHNGSTITYTSLNPEYMDDDGTFLQPVSQRQYVTLEGTATLDDKTETFLLSFFIEPLSLRYIFELRFFIHDQGMVLIDGVIYHLEHLEDEGVYWVMLYDETGYLRMRIPDSYNLEIGDNLRIAGMYEYEFDYRGEIIDVRYLASSPINIEIPDKNFITVNEFLTMNRYNDLPFHSGMPVHLVGYVKQVGTAYYLYDELLDQRVRIFSENTIDWSVYKDQYVEMMMFVDTVFPVRTLTTLKASDLVVTMSEEYIDLRKDALEIRKTPLESFGEDFELPLEGTNGSSITWESLSPDLVSNEGEVLKSVDVITPVKFIATLEQDEYSITIEVEVYLLTITDIGDLQRALYYNGEAIIEAVVYYIDDYGYVYFTDGTGNIIHYANHFDDVKIGDAYQLRGRVRYTPGFNTITFESLTSHKAIEMSIEIPSFEGPYTVHNVIDLDVKAFSLITLRGVLYVDNSVYLYDELTDTKFAIYPGFYLEPYKDFEGELIEIDVLIYQRGDYYEMRIDGAEEGIRVLDDVNDRRDYELLYFENLTFTTYRSSVELPNQGPLGNEIIEWTSMNTTIFTDDGTLVELPDENTIVTFTGKLVIDGIEHAIEIDVLLMAVANSIASYGVFNGVKEVFIEGVIYSVNEDFGQFYYFIYDGTGFAVITESEDIFNVGDMIMIKSMAEYFDGWLVLASFASVDDILYEIFPNDKYDIPHLGEKSFETIFENGDLTGYIITVEGTIAHLGSEYLAITDAQNNYTIDIFTSGELDLSSSDVGRTIQIDIIVVTIGEGIGFAFFYSEGHMDFLD